MLRKYRRRAEICLAASHRTRNAATARRLRLMAGEYLCRAEMLERRSPPSPPLAPTLAPKDPCASDSHPIADLLARLVPHRLRVQSQDR